MDTPLILGSLSKGVFKWGMSTRSKALSFLTYPVPWFYQICQTTAQECMKSTTDWNASLKNIFAYKLTTVTFYSLLFSRDCLYSRLSLKGHLCKMDT